MVEELILTYLEDSLNNAIVIIEWPEIIENILPKDRVTITIKDKTFNSRTAILEGNRKFIDLIQ